MLESNKKNFVLFFIIMCVFLIGVFKLFVLRFEGGDIYPAYSSLRSDPLGTKVLYESLENLKSRLISRNYRSLYRGGSRKDITLFYLVLVNPFPEEVSSYKIFFIEHFHKYNFLK